MTNFDRLTRSYRLRQIARQSETRHSSTVSVSIIRSPSRLYSMQIKIGELRPYQWMSVVDTGVE
jgi:hypothetical protein